MIICHEHKFIFIKSPKTAGTSVQVALEPFCSDGDIVTRIIPYEPPLANYTPRNDEDWHSHLSASEIRARIDPKIWDTYYKFTFERNPWDRTISLYWFRRWGRGEEAKKMYAKMLEDPITIFPDWLDRAKLIPNYPMYTEDGEAIVDFVGTYENLQADMAKACAEIGLTGVQELPTMKAGYREDRRHYSEYFTTQELVDRVAEVYRWEIDHFNYEFERK